MIINQWYAIMPSKQLRKKQIVAVRRLNLDLVLFRYASGVLGCVIDKCTHRGAALSQGRLNVDCLQCPFHGIEFDTEGKCRFVPSIGISSKEDLSRYNVKSYPVREIHGIIYFWYGDDDKVNEDIPFFAPLEGKNAAYSEISDKWNAHYTRCIEDHLDVMHRPFVHHEKFGRGSRKLVNGPKVEFDGKTLRTSADNEIDIGQRPKTAQEITISDTNYLVFKFPNIWTYHMSDRTWILTFFAPVDDENTVVYMRYYSKAVPVQFINQIIAFFGKFRNRSVDRTDKRIVTSQKPKASSLDGGEILLDGDAPILAYRKARAAMEEQQKAG